MKADVHLWSHLAQFFLVREIFQNKKLSENNRNIFMVTNIFPPKSCLSSEKYGKVWSIQTGCRWQYRACALHACTGPCGSLVWVQVIHHHNSNTSP